MAWPFGIGPRPAGRSAVRLDWRAGLWASALFCCLAFFFLVLLTVSIPRPRNPPPLPATASTAMNWRRWAASRIGLVWAGYNATFAVAVGFAPAFLTARGMTRARPACSPPSSASPSCRCSRSAARLAERSGRPMLGPSCVSSVCPLPRWRIARGGPSWCFLPLFGVSPQHPRASSSSLQERSLSPETRAFGMGVLYSLFLPWPRRLAALGGACPRRDGLGGCASPGRVGRPRPHHDRALGLTQRSRKARSHELSRLR